MYATKLAEPPSWGQHLVGGDDLRLSGESAPVRSSGVTIQCEANRAGSCPVRCG